MNDLKELKKAHLRQPHDTSQTHDRLLLNLTHRTFRTPDPQIRSLQSFESSRRPILSRERTGF
jgi:hypothetical protein